MNGAISGRGRAGLSRDVACSGAAGPALPPLPEVLRSKKTCPPETFTRRIRACAQKGAWAEALKILAELQQEDQADLFHYNAAISACSSPRQAWVARALREEMSQQRLDPDVYTYGALLRSADANAAKELLEEMKQRGVKRNVVVSSLAMKALVNGGDWKMALKLFEAKTADAKLFTSALGACSAGSCWAQAFSLLDEMREVKVAPDRMTWNAVMTVCARAGQWQQALSIFDRMDTRPDIFTFNSALQALRFHSSWQMALNLFRRLPEHALQPDMVSFNTLMAITAEQQPNLAIELLGEMYDASVPRSERSYFVLMASTSQHWERALTLFDHCKQEGIAPTTHLYGAAIQACSVGRQWHHAVELVREMKGAALPLNNEVCAAAINSCVVPFDSGQDDVWLEALRLFQDLTATTDPDGVTYIALLSAFAGCSRWEEALLLHRQTEHSESLEDRLRCTNCVVTACARGIAWPIALQVFDETPRPSLVTNNAVLSAFAEGSQWRLALQVLQELPRQKLSPTEVTLNTVLYALCRGSHHVAAQRLLGNMPSYSLTADLYSYTTVMSACTSVSCWEMTCDLLCTMISKKIGPDIYSINNIIGALANTPKWKEALHMFSNMQNFRMAPDFVTHSVIIAGRLQAAAQEGQQMLPGSMELERRW